MKKTILEQIAEFFSKHSDYSHLTPPIIASILSWLSNIFRCRFVSKSKEDVKSAHRAGSEEFKLSLDTDTVKTTVKVKGEKMAESAKPLLSELARLLSEVANQRKEKSDDKEKTPPEKEEQINPKD